MGTGKRKIDDDVAVKSGLRIAFIVSAAIVGCVSSACSSADSNVNIPNSNSRINANRATLAPSNSQTTTFGTVNSGNINTNKPIDPAMQKMEQIRSAANRAGKPIPSMNTRPAPEDSTITSTLTDVARETRVWKKDPILAKVEKIYDGGEGSIKVYLRNGKVIDLPGKSIAQLAQIPSAAILSIAGVQSTSAQASASKNRSLVKRSDN